MLRSTFPVPRLRPVRPSRVGDNPRDDRAPALRRLAGALALLALLAALPTPALAAPAGDSPAFSGAVVLDWIQGLLARLGVVITPGGPAQDSPASLQQYLGDEMDPNGATISGTSDDSAPSEQLFLGDDMDPNG